jgi:hypothetical protein
MFDAGRRLSKERRDLNGGFASPVIECRAASRGPQRQAAAYDAPARRSQFAGRHRAKIMNFRKIVNFVIDLV